METELPHSSHRFSTWDVYPRISRHRSRFKDLYSRFKNVMRTIPESLHDTKVKSELQMLNEQLDMDFVVNVFGRKLERRDIAICEMFEASPSENLGISIDVIILKHDGVNETEFMNYTDALVGKYFRDFLVTESQEIVLFRETHLPMSELTFEKLYSRLITTFKLPDHIVQKLHIRKNSTNTLKAELSDAFERWIEKGFSNVEIELNRFTPRHWLTNIENSRPRKTTNGWMTNTISDVIRQFLRDVSNVLDYSISSIDKVHSEDASEVQGKALASRIRCISVGILSSKFKLPQWVCNALLLEKGFEKNIISSFSRTTRYYLNQRSAYVDDRITKKFDFLGYVILKEIKPLEAIEKDFSMMNRSVQVMKRMRREVCHYMKQFWERNEQLNGGRNLAEQFDIRRLDERTRIDGQNQTHLSAYRLKELKLGPQQGDQLLSPVPGNTKKHRMGTLGGFVKGKNGQLYAVTCAHVVDHPTRKHDVSSKKRGQSAQPLGTSSPELTLNLHSGDSPFDDIAAVVIPPDISEQCNLTLMNDKGQPKPALLATEPPEVGTYVYKIGAKTGLTTGVVAESHPEDKLPQHIFWIESCPGNDEDIQDILDPLNDHSLSTKIQACNEINDFSDLEISCCSSQQYAQITDEENELPDTTTEKTKTDTSNPGQNIKFAEQGDSGALVFAIVTTIYAELIIILSMISGGDFESRDGTKNSHEKEYMSFLLKTGLERLGLKFKNDPEFFELA